MSACSGNSINLNELTGVTAISGSDAWASGSEGNVDGRNFHIPCVLPWNGTDWSLVGSPAPGSAHGTPVDSLSGVTSPAAGTVFAVGAREIPGQCCLRTLALKTTSG
jgi:hypothetical protein